MDLTNNVETQCDDATNPTSSANHSITRENRIWIYCEFLSAKHEAG